MVGRYTTDNKISGTAIVTVSIVLHATIPPKVLHKTQTAFGTTSAIFLYISAIVVDVPKNQ